MGSRCSPGPRKPVAGLTNRLTATRFRRVLVIGTSLAARPTAKVATESICIESFTQTRLASSMRAATGCWCTVDATIKVERSTSRTAKLSQRVSCEL